MDGRVLQTINIGSPLHTVTTTPENFGSMNDDGFISKCSKFGDY